MKKKRMGEILIEKGLITEEQIENALLYQEGKNKKIGKVLIELGYINAMQVAEALTKQFSLKMVDCNDYIPSDAVLALIRKETAEQKLVFPLELNNNTLSVAMANPLDWETIENIGFETGLTLNVAISSEGNILNAIEQYYTSAQDAWNVLKELPSYDNVEFIREEMESEQQSNILEASEAAPVIRLVTAVLADAVNVGASDIHIEAKKDHVQVRYRIDGALKNIQQYPKQIQDAVTSRIKIISNLDITNRRFPQDGRSALRLADKTVDLRVSTLPSAHGEKVVIRLLDSSTGLVPLDQLGISEHISKPLIEIATMPQGMLLVTGPTGSGKSTSLYSILQFLREETKNIMTLEDPIEYELDGITQVAIKESIGFTFASALRSVLRQDPDIVMVGEIRDLDTAEIAARAALTGHFVFSTLHTNDSVATVSRLIDIGLEPFLITSAVSGILAQRLIRTICPDCKIKIPEPEEAKKFNLPPLGEYYKGEGCQKCNHTGYKGRVGVYELLRMDSKLKSVIAGEFTTADLWNCAKKSGAKTMLDDAWLKVKEGITTLDEVIAKIPSHEFVMEEKKAVSKKKVNNKILVFNDDEAEISMVRSALEEDGYEVLHSTNGNMLEMTNRENPFLIIVNNTQEKLEYIKELRDKDQLAYIPIICLSDPEYKDYEAEGFGMGINDFLYRPVYPQKLLFAVLRIAKAY
jgi:type IV pilus assembly protein PilB